MTDDDRKKDADALPDEVVITERDAKPRHIERHVVETIAFFACGLFAVAMLLGAVVWFSSPDDRDDSWERVQREMEAEMRMEEEERAKSIKKPVPSAPPPLHAPIP